jgi:hypothetical protein
MTMLQTIIQYCTRSVHQRNNYFRWTELVDRKEYKSLVKPSHFPSAVTKNNPPEHIVIEASGVADPKGVYDSFLEPEIRSLVLVDGVIRYRT